MPMPPNKASTFGRFGLVGFCSMTSKRSEDSRSSLFTRRGRQCFLGCILQILLEGSALVLEGLEPAFELPGLGNERSPEQRFVV